MDKLEDVAAAAAVSIAGGCYELSFKLKTPYLATWWFTGKEELI
jgi:hypothetical protein